MIIIPFVLSLIILKLTREISWLLLPVILIIYLPFISYGREFIPISGFIDDMEVYHSIYLAQIKNGSFIFSNSKLEIFVPIIFKIIGLLGDIGIKSLYLLMITIQVSTLFFAIVGDKRSCLIFLVIIYSAPFIIYSGLFIRQIFSICLFLYCIKTARHRFWRGYFFPIASVFAHLTTILLLLFNCFGSILEKWKYIRQAIGFMLIALFVMMIYQPLTYPIFIKLMLTFFPRQAGFFEMTTVIEPVRLSLTAFLFSTVVIIYGFVFKKFFQYRIIIVFLIIMIACFAFGQIPFLASRAALLVIVFGPVLVLSSHQNRGVDRILLLYPLYTLIAFSLHASLFLRNNFGKILLLW